MKDLTILLPIHKLDNTDEESRLVYAIESVRGNIETYKDAEVKILVIVPNEDLRQQVQKLLEGCPIIKSIEICINDTEKSDYASQINYGASKVETEHFSILEFDDFYMPNWFANARRYSINDEAATVYLPLEYIKLDGGKDDEWEFGNEMVWAKSFSNELGVIDFDCLQNCTVFNLTGGIFNTKDFIAIGGLKPSIKLSFNYEFLLRLTSKDLKAYVVPKLGYSHTVGRNGSLTDEYKDMDKEEAQRWFDLAKREYKYKEDRYKTIKVAKKEKIK
jgi:hypothetical protein